MNNYKYGPASQRELDSCAEPLQVLADELIKYMDVSVICGHRSDQEQDRLYREGKSKLKGGKSKHNHKPSLAMDLAPYPYPDEWSRQDMHRLYYMAGMVKGLAESMGIPVRMGADWDGDGELADQTFHDVFHVELDTMP